MERSGVLFEGRVVDSACQAFINHTCMANILSLNHI